MTRRQRGGFTLIELVASALLTAMMMAALLSVVWSATRESRQLRRSATARMPTTQLVSQMRRDFQNARGLAITPYGVSLHGFLDQDPRTGNLTLLPASVRYRRVEQGGRAVLIRSIVGTSGSSRAPAWVGFGALRVEPLEQTEPEDALLLQPIAGGLPPAPGSFRVTMLGDQGQVLWREVIHHHAS